MVPTLAATPGVKGHRPTVPTRDGKDRLYVFAVVNLIRAALHTDTPASPHDAKKRTGKSKTRRLQEAFATPCATSDGCIRGDTTPVWSW